VQTQLQDTQLQEHPRTQMAKCPSQPSRPNAVLGIWVLSVCHFAFSISSQSDYRPCMALVRILVDGYSLLHGWPELARGKPRHSAAARDELIQVLTRYQDTAGTPVTIFFDGSGAPPHVPKDESTRHVEVLFSKAGQTADDMIERAAHRFQPYGEVLAVTDDYAERDTVIAMGGSATSCEIFIAMVRDALTELAEDVKYHNRTERHRYQRSR
jgi:uncharacterized protein